ncbi:ImmA/IrrE family metallo-endopeptidase [Corynebacterium callunae]|uniref:ImmA/IrrE family metallo-endopeptidase n=1 Tax=Corynebacterium callunae TaxID=1721 RepID=UPI00398243B6
MPDIRNELHPEDLGGWFPQSRRVLYRTGLSWAETICAVAHELGHAIYGDTHTDDHLRDSRQELRADRWAVEALISQEAYARAERLVGSHPGALAIELGVTVEYVNLWRQIYEKVKVL